MPPKGTKRKPEYDVDTREQNVGKLHKWLCDPKQPQQTVQPLGENCALAAKQSVDYRYNPIHY